MKIISEKTLYKFVFFPETVEEEERIFISQNVDQFRENIKFLEEMKTDLYKELPESILNRIYKKIEETSLTDGITLNLIKNTDDKGKCILAADSISDATPKTCSFVDETNSYLIKVINKEEKTYIYIFTKIQEEDLEYSLTLFPSKENHYLNTSDLPLIISPQQKIKSIQLKTI